MSTDAVYRSSPFRAYPCGVGTHLCAFELTDTVRVLTSDDVRLLASCDEPQSLADHGRAYVTHAGAPGRGPAVLARLAELASTGFLTAEADLIARCVRASLDASPNTDEAAIEWLAIPTRDRPEPLERAVSSFIENARAHGRSPRVLVVDDARVGLARAELVPRLRACTAAFGLVIDYAGRAEREAYCGGLEQAGIPREVARFTLLGSDVDESYGAARNSILVHTLGHKVLCVDDDTVCQPCCGPSHRDDASLVIAGDHDETEMWFYGDHVAVAREARATRLDVLGAHGAALGRAPATLAGEAAVSGARVTLDKACAHALKALTGGGRVLITSNGVAGDSGMYSGELLVRKRGVTGERLTASEQAFMDAITGRELIRHASATTIVHGAPVSSMFLGIDNRELLPPYVPVCRNEDGLFGMMLRTCCAQAFQAQLPWALIHRPPGHPTYERDAWARVRFADVVAALLDAWAAGVMRETTAQRLSAFGAECERFSRLPERDFAHVLGELMRRRALALVHEKEGLLRDSPERPYYWRTEVRRQMLLTLRAVSRPEYGVPHDLRGSLGRDPVQHTRQLIGDVGRTLQWWPALTEAVRDLATRGVRLARPVV